MYSWLKEVANGTTSNHGKRFQVICTVMLMTYTLSGMIFFIPSVFNDVLKRSSRRSSHKVCCLNMVKNDTSIENDKKKIVEDCDQHIINSPDDAKKKKEKYDVEFKIILLGATGSGKSSAGNVLLQKHGNNEGFETSCYAKSQTKQSVLKSVIKTVTSKNVCKRYKIDIIDTPAISNTELTDEDAIDQLKEAKRMSHPGPHAFLFCVPVNTITNHFTNVIESKDLPFDGRLFDSTIVVFTRCDQFKSQNDSKLNCKDVMKQNHILKKMKYHITLSNKLSQDKKSKKLDDVIGIIIKIDNENKKSWYSRFLSFFYTKHQRSK